MPLDDISDIAKFKWFFCCQGLERRLCYDRLALPPFCLLLVEPVDMAGILKYKQG